MLHNNMVYKGYRLTASVSRVSVGGTGRPAFTATVAVELAADRDQLNEHHAVPLFESGGFVSSPGMAVDAAINHGRLVVDSHARPS
ncbi:MULTISPECIES: hypothetical protein [Achromobacter]|uniref:Uncharacterized protein n=2 Tax=Achromobacter piechaudii TaxID=72556 RepID=A0A6S7EDF4_9BURK|nr:MULTISPECIES: hypothetical protein [Achromobacter]EFF76792.1 hypothetical protein HMPREF0004_1880 [Achromobacter piechaudii ATCC 43553]KNY12375.1 hypothetical protein AKG08_02740 [Achromobacter piechaudii]MPS78845.1 hypothetical protein [Achromobacter sp.]CAB3715672.1 hypothetical protein LMG1873_03487 [Achromobacter piechaudii]CAB3882771.1 hypothetical protein LMG2828_03571 [Achromobacter piechaudii]